MLYRLPCARYSPVWSKYSRADHCPATKKKSSPGREPQTIAFRAWSGGRDRTNRQTDDHQSSSWMWSPAAAAPRGRLDHVTIVSASDYPSDIAFEIQRAWIEPGLSRTLCQKPHEDIDVRLSR